MVSWCAWRSSTTRAICWGGSRSQHPGNARRNPPGNLQTGILVSALGLIFGLLIFTRLKNMPVHQSMREVSELIYETCKTYLATQFKFLCILECFIAVIIIFYFLRCFLIFF